MWFRAMIGSIDFDFTYSVKFSWLKGSGCDVTLNIGKLISLFKDALGVKRWKFHWSYWWWFPWYLCRPGAWTAAVGGYGLVEAPAAAAGWTAQIRARWWVPRVQPRCCSDITAGCTDRVVLDLSKIRKARERAPSCDVTGSTQTRKRRRSCDLGGWSGTCWIDS